MTVEAHSTSATAAADRGPADVRTTRWLLWAGTSATAGLGWVAVLSARLISRGEPA